MEIAQKGLQQDVATEQYQGNKEDSMDTRFFFPWIFLERIKMPLVFLSMCIDIICLIILQHMILSYKDYSH